MPKPRPPPPHRFSEANLDRVDVPMMSKKYLLEQRSIRYVPFTSGKIGALVLLLGLAACRKEKKAAATPMRPVRTITVEPWVS
jgi:hypothetical protein